MPMVSLFHEILQPKKVRTGIKHRTQAALPLYKPPTEKQIHRLTEQIDICMDRHLRLKQKYYRNKTFTHTYYRLFQA